MLGPRSNSITHRENFAQPETLKLGKLKDWALGRPQVAMHR